jgi:hypothetical protein
MQFSAIMQKSAIMQFLGLWITGGRRILRDFCGQLSVVAE